MTAHDIAKNRALLIFWGRDEARRISRGEACALQALPAKRRRKLVDDLLRGQSVLGLEYDFTSHHGKDAVSVDLLVHVEFQKAQVQEGTTLEIEHPPVAAFISVTDEGERPQRILYALVRPEGGYQVIDLSPGERIGADFRRSDLEPPATPLHEAAVATVDKIFTELKRSGKVAKGSAPLAGAFRQPRSEPRAPDGARG